jgi:predicted GTPase
MIKDKPEMERLTARQLWKHAPRTPGMLFIFARIFPSFRREVSKPIRIAVIGEPGVGRRTTLDAVFNRGSELPEHKISHIKESEELEIPVEIRSYPNGPVRVYNLPVVGYSGAIDHALRLTYANTLRRCELVLWVVDANKPITDEQVELRDMMLAVKGDLRNVVVAINRVDEVRPGTWVPGYNISDPEQKKSIEEVVSDIREKLALRELTSDRIVPISATAWFHISKLVTEMQDSFTELRNWVFIGRTNYADYTKKISPKILKEVIKSKNP